MLMILPSPWLSFAVTSLARWTPCQVDNSNGYGNLVLGELLLL